MTTDNRTNEPNQNETKSGQELCFTEAQVEAAAKAMHEARNPWFAAYGGWGAAGFEIKQAFRKSARAALVAAAGVAALEATLPSGRCSNPECPLNRAHSGPCAPQEWTGGDAVVLAAKYLAQAASDWSDTETGEHSHSLECTNWEAYQRDAHDMRAALVAAQGAAPVLPSNTVDEDALAEVLIKHSPSASSTGGFAACRCDRVWRSTEENAAHIAHAVAERLKEQGR